jgi:hypothetical protein
MILAVPLVETSRGPIPPSSLQSETSAEECALPSQLLACAPPEDPLEEMLLVEMRYQQHLAERELQGLFENGVLQVLEC